MGVFKATATRQVRVLIAALVGAALFVAASHWTDTVERCEVQSRSPYFCIVFK